MWLGFTEGGRKALRRGHEVVTRVDVLHGGWPVYQLEVADGSVQMEADSAIRSSLSCQLIDPTGELSRGDVDALLDPYDSEIAVYRGVRYQVTSYGQIFVPNAGFGVQGFGTTGFGGQDVSTITAHRYETELAPLGVFGITSKAISDTPEGMTVQLTGQDRAMGYQVPMRSSLSIPGATSVEAAIMKLLSKVNPSLVLFAMATKHTVGPLLYTPDIDVWGEAQSLATSVGARLYHDRVGRCVLMPAGGNRYPVLSYREGDGLLLSVDRNEDSDTIRNVVIAQSSDGAVRVVAYDADSTSPTYAGGRYGFRPFFLENEHFGTTAQAQEAAVAALVRELGRVETVSYTAIPDPSLDVIDAVTVDRPRAGLDQRALVVDSIDMPLTVDASMRVNCRKSVLTQDGDVLPEETT